MQERIDREENAPEAVRSSIRSQENVLRCSRSGHVLSFAWYKFKSMGDL